MKKGRLSEIEKQYILQNVQWGAEAISAALQRSEASVQKVLESAKVVLDKVESAQKTLEELELKIQEKHGQLKAEHVDPQMPTFKDIVGRSTATKQKGVTFMTEAGSEMGDNKSNGPNNKYKDCIAPSQP